MTDGKPSDIDQASPEKTAIVGSAPVDDEPGIPSVSQPPRVSVARKDVLAVVFAIVALIVISAGSIHRAFSGPAKEETAKRLGDRPAAAGTEPRRLDLTLPVPAVLSASAASATGRMIPAIQPLADDPRSEPIALRRSDPPRVAPEDAPVVLVAARPNGGGATAVSSPLATTGSTAADGTGEPADPLDSTRRNLDAYQHQLQGLLDTLTQSTALAGRQGSTSATAPQMPPPSAASPGASLLGGLLPASATPRVVAGMLGNRSLTLAKGTAFTCALKTRLISATSGFVSCQVLRNVYSEDGRVLLIERGSHMDGEYRATAVRPGTVRIPVLWTRVRTPNGVTVDIESPGTGQLGESGIDGYVDNRWLERIGAALLLSLIDDAVQIAIAGQTSDAPGSTVVLPSTTSTTGKLAEKVLDSTINIAPLIYQNQGAIVGIHVARDVDFSSVYELKAVQR
jgi:type IV secretion system protein VirB10